MGICIDAFEKVDLSSFNQCVREDEQAVWVFIVAIGLALAIATLLRSRATAMDFTTPLILEIGPSAYRFGQRPHRSTEGVQPTPVGIGRVNRRKKAPKKQKRGR